jgi:serine/threonine protein phosphatase PrpC
LLEKRMNDYSNSALESAGYYGARLRAGKRGSQIGDAILIDPARGFFAVGDSSDREPRAARRFMLKFSELLNSITILSTKGIVPVSQLEALMSEIVERSRQILLESVSQGTTTFTGTLILATEHATKALLFHTGDSILMAYHPQRGIRQITKKNFWLIGKVQEFYQVAVIDVILGDRFLLASDGLQDLIAPEGKQLDAYIADLFSQYPVQDIPDRLIGSCDTRTEGRDDLAVLALAPDRPFPDLCGILLGG